MKQSFAKHVRMAILLTGSLVPAIAYAEPTLYLYNWTDYMSPNIIKKFEAKYHCKVVQNYYNSLGEMAAKLEAGGDSQYDIVVPSNYFLKRMIDAGLLSKLDAQKIPNLKNLLPQFKNPQYDPHNTYSVPYQWGMTGIGYDSSKVNLPPKTDGWALLFNPKFNDKYPFALMGGSGQDTIGAACAYLGYGFNCTGTVDWEKAAKLIVATEKRHNFVGFLDGTPARHALTKGVIAAGIMFSGTISYDILKHPKKFAHIRYILPKSGAEIWVDNMCIPKNAPDKALAYDFINFILSPKIGAELSNYNNYASPNQASIPYLKPLLKTPYYLPPKKVLAHLKYLPELSGKELQEYDQIWTAVRSQ